MSSFELKPMMESFRAHLMAQHEEMLKHIPGSVVEGQKKYQEMVKADSFKNLPVAQKNKIRDRLKYLNKCLKLRIFSWNGERYDNNVVWAPLMDNFQHHKAEFQKMTIIRRGTGIMEFKFGNLVFRDFLNYSCPMSLDTFAKSCGITAVEKTTFPYELYQDIAKLRTVTDFPPYPLFKSSLRKGDEKNKDELMKLVNENLGAGIWKDTSEVQSFFQFAHELEFELVDSVVTNIKRKDGVELSDDLHTSPSKYFNSKMIFDNSCENMTEYLRRYNLNDVVLLEQCIKAYASGFWDSWKVNIHDNMSLPGVAQGKLANKKI